MNKTTRLIAACFAVSLMLFANACSDKKSRQNTFVTEKEYQSNYKFQTEGVSAVLKQLRSLNITPDKKLPLEYFFYTDKSENATQLADELKKMDYEVSVEPSASDSTQLCINGWTQPMKMSEKVVETWAGEMCEVGYEYDCEFDGWGTDPTR